MLKNGEGLEYLTRDRRGKDWRRLCRMARGCGRPQIRGPSWNGGTEARDTAPKNRTPHQMIETG